MAYLTEVSSFDSVLRLETTTQVLGGAGGVANTPAQGLTNRTKWLSDNKQAISTNLTALSTLASAANKIPYFTGSGAAAMLDLDTDGTLTANSDTKLATQKAVKTFVSGLVTGLLRFKSATDCSANPNYPAAVKGDSYVVSVAGKIGGASGAAVDIGDLYFATADNAGGTQAAVGTSWAILEHNLNGALLTANALSELTGVASTARTNLGLGTMATQAANSVAITGGSVDGASIGAITPAAAVVTTLTATGAVSLQGQVTIADAQNVAVGTTTGTKIGTTTAQKLGFYGVTPIAQRSGAAQAAIASTAATNVAPYGFSTAAQADSIVTLANELRAWAVAQGFIKGSA